MKLKFLYHKAFQLYIIAYTLFTTEKTRFRVSLCDLPQYKLFIKYRNINKPSESIYIIQTTIKSLQSHKMYFLVIHVAGIVGPMGRHRQYTSYIFIQSSFYTQVIIFINCKTINILQTTQNIILWSCCLM